MHFQEVMERLVAMVQVDISKVNKKLGEPSIGLQTRLTDYNKPLEELDDPIISGDDPILQTVI